MPAPQTASTKATDGSAAFLVLGMHRSGTSALARLLADAGADVGQRVIPASAGNEGGHWEDAFAVETNEWLLAEMGRRWDDIRPLPRGWEATDAALEARGRIAAYVRGNRLSRPAWAIKDPRLCLLAPVWIAALSEAGCTPSVLLLARHPQEVIESLVARDGMPHASAGLLWVRHLVEAERTTRALPRAWFTYDQLLRAPLAVLEHIRRLPGGQQLAAGDGSSSAIDPGARHHVAGSGELEGLSGDVWRAFVQAASGEPADAVHALDACAEELHRADGLYAPVLSDLAHEQSLLWQRTARAEAALSNVVATGRDELAALGGSLDSGVNKILDAVSVDIRRMQDEHAKAIAAAAAIAAEADAAKTALANEKAAGAGVARGIATQVGEMRNALQRMDEHVSHALGTELRALRMQLDASLGEAAALRERARVSQAEIDALVSQVEASREQLQHARSLLSGEQARVRVLQEHSDQLRHVLASRSWRITRPLRSLGRLLRGEGGEDLRKAKQLGWRALAGVPLLPKSRRERWRLRGEGPFKVTAGADVVAIPAIVQPAVSVDGKPDVFVWAVIDWHFRTQRPQHLARGLAHAGHRVFYISNNLVDDAQPGFDVEPLEDGGRLFQVRLNVAGAPQIYGAGPSSATVAQLRASMGELMQWADSDGGLCIVQHPFWADVAASVSGAALLYDCMDHHAGFENNSHDVLASEERLARAANLLVVTSEWLDREMAVVNPNRALVRNACDFAHFSAVPHERFVDARNRRVIGYFGAIAEWFDVELVRAVAMAFPDCLVLLIGADTIAAAQQLREHENVVFVGEVPYAKLPFYLHGFDVAILPFRVIPLTLATNPVKVYEYLSAGKPVVCVDLPEIQQFGGLVARAADSDGFVSCVAEALSEDDAARVAARQAFASEQTWEHRAAELDQALAGMPEPLVSVVVLTFNNLEFTRACLRSIEAETHWRSLEVIVVDNRSTDGTREFLADWAEAGPGRRVILNDSNLGFAAGNNVGLAAANGDYLVLLNNDTYVTPHWLRTMVNHLRRHPDIGILGPVTNNIGNEARIEVQYADMAEMRRAAAAHTRRHLGQLLDLDTVAFFCVAMPRSTYEAVGPLDEAFGVGFFEDDDYCRRVQKAGLRVVCAEDVFVHHHLSATFDSLKAEKKQELFLKNKAIYEAKWGPWQPHAYRGARAPVHKDGGLA